MPFVVEFAPDRQAQMIASAGFFIVPLLRAHGTGKMKGLGDSRLVSQFVEQAA